MKKLLLLLFLSLGLIGSANACYYSSIIEPQPFLGIHGEVFELDDGSIWEVQHSYEYLYAYYPYVTVCVNYVIVDGVKIDTRNIYGGGRPGYTPVFGEGAREAGSMLGKGIVELFGGTPAESNGTSGQSGNKWEKIISNALSNSNYGD